MSNDPKKLASMYEEYLISKLKTYSKEELLEKFLSTVLESMDFTNPEVQAQVVKILLRDEHKKKAKGMVEEEAPPLPERTEEALPTNSGEELDFSSMYKPNDFEDLIAHVSVLKESHSEIVELGDMLNLVSVIKSVRPYMFDVEVPWVGLIEDTLCISWSRDRVTNVIIAFLEGQIQLELTHKEEFSELLLDDDGLLEEYNLEEILKEISDIQY